MDFRELLAVLREPPEDGLPDTIYDDLDASYSATETSRDSATGEVETYRAALTAAEAEISTLKETIADMVLSAPGNDEGNEPDGDGDTFDPDTITIDDLF